MQSVISVTQPCPTLCRPMNCSIPGFPVPHELPELAQTHIHRVSDAIQPSHPLSSPFSSCLQSFPATRSFPMSQGFPGGPGGKESAFRAGNLGLIPWLERSSGKGQYQSTLVFLSGETPWTEEPGWLESIGSQSWT